MEDPLRERRTCRIHPNQHKIKLFDPNYGGRWNAGSNGRGGGTSLEPRNICSKTD